MKKSITEVVKVLLASVVGTGMVMFAMWFLWGGGEILFLFLAPTLSVGVYTYVKVSSGVWIPTYNVGTRE